MEMMNDEGQWIVLIGFIVAISLFFLAIVVSESTLVGQTTSEAVLDFSKANIQDLAMKTRDLAVYDNPAITSQSGANVTIDIQKLYSERKGVIAIIDIKDKDPFTRKGNRNVTLHYNDGITSYDAYQLDLITGL
jgi:hypothetical protein